VWLEEICQLKIPMTPSEIEPTTFRFVAQLRHGVPQELHDAEANIHC
jgi:hypothetical protein